MHEIFPGSPLPLEWLCKVYLEWCADSLENQDDHLKLEETLFGVEIVPQMSSYISLLLSLNSASTLAKLANGAKSYKIGNYSEARIAIKSVFSESERSTTNFHATYVLCKCTEKLCDDIECEVYINTATMLLDEKVKDLATRRRIKQNLDEMLIKCLYRQLKLTEAIHIIRSFECKTPSSYSTLILWAKLYANFGDRSSVQNLLQYDYKVLPFDRSLLNAMLLRSESKCDLAIKEIEECDDMEELEVRDKFEIMLLRGQLLWESNKPNESLPVFLTAARLNPYSWVPFLYLGHFYHKIEGKRDLEKAAKCYKKCLSLNPSSEEAGAMLSDIYRAQGKWEENLEFLTSITQQSNRAPNASGQKIENKWASLRLGMHYLACERFSQAIQSLQSVLRADPKNIDAWESLADAYASRGSFSAALKAYDKILRLRDDSKHLTTEIKYDGLYAELQIAAIKHKLGHFNEAVVGLKGILVNEPTYVPAIKILGEALLDQAKEFLDQSLSRNTLDNCQQALTYLTTAVKSSNADLACLWTLMGHACLMIHPISSDIVTSSGFQIPDQLLSSAEETKLKQEGSFICVDKLTVIRLSSKCYIRALQIQSDNANCWHDLALSYQAQIQEDEQFNGALNENEKRDLKQKCLTSIKRAIQLEPTSYIHWNALGVFQISDENFHNDAETKSTAQHAFIKSIETENNSVSWTNLGILYLLSNEYELANKAFKQAQNQDPSYIYGWVGQALLAEFTGFDEEAMDLFRHTTILGNEPESAVGYAYWICRTINRIFREGQQQRTCLTSSECDKSSSEKIKNNHGQYCVESMYGVTVATDCLIHYLDRIGGNTCVLNMLGVLLERDGVFKPAKRIMLSAIKSVTHSSKEPENINEEQIQLLDQIRQNLGRVCFKIGDYDTSEEQYLMVTKRDFYGQIGLALSASKNNRHPQEVYNAYTLALEMAESDYLKSQVLAAMATIAYKVQGGEASKTLLFQSCQLQPPCVNSIFALLVLGIKQSDVNLIGAALGEIERFVKTQPEHQVEPHLADITWLKALVLVLQGKRWDAQVVLSKAIHITPHIYGLWQAMALHLLNSEDKKLAVVAANCAQKSAEIKLSKLNKIGSNLVSLASNEDITLLTLVAFCLTYAEKSDRKAALKAASKAVHTYPYLVETWTILLAAVSSAQQNEDTCRDNKLILMKVALSAKMVLTSNMGESRAKNNDNKLSQWITHYLQ